MRTVLGLLAGLGLLVSTAGRATAQGQPLTVQRTATGRPVPSGFVGLSMEFRGLAAYAGSDPRAVDPVFLNLIREIAPGQQPILRIGGDSTDWTWWSVPHARRPPGVRYDLTARYMRVARSVAEQTNARLVMGINLEADNRRDAAGEAHAMVNRIGARNIDALEIGNEPELYSAFPWYRAANGARVLGRPPGWDPAQFAAEFTGLAHVMPGVPLAGPSSGSAAWLADLGSFLRTEPRVRLTTIHAYPLKHCVPTQNATIAQLLANSSSSGFARSLAPFAAIAHRNGKRIRVDEMNAVSCGGQRGVSDTFASSLWVLDTLFEMLRAGVDGVNVHTVPDTINEVLGPSLANGRWSMRVHPEYYGMIMFARAAPPGSRLLALSSATPAGVKVWATRARNGDVRVLLINDHSRRSDNLRLRIPALNGPAAVQLMRAPSIHATRGVTVGDRSFGAATTTGLLRTPAPGSLTAVRGTYHVHLLAASATLLTLSPHAGHTSDEGCPPPPWTSARTCPQRPGARARKSPFETSLEAR